jgi:hypothetical protein
MEASAGGVGTEATKLRKKNTSAVLFIRVLVKCEAVASTERVSKAASQSIQGV